MVEVLSFLRTYEAWVYAIVVLIAIWQVWKFVQAWNELRSAAFGLEREKAQANLNVAAIWLLLCLLIAVGEFYLVSFIVPTIPDANPLPTPTLNLEATLTPELSTTPGQVTPSVEVTLGTLPSLDGSGCISDTVMITYPEDGMQVEGVVTLEGTADIANFGFYKYEIARPGDPVWLSINAGREKVVDGKLGDWDTRTLPTDEYLLRLVVIDNEGISLEACVIRVRVIASSEGSP